MSVAASPSDAHPAQPKHAIAALESIRASGLIALECAVVGQTTRIVDLTESGGYRLKFPDCGERALNAVIVNTGGGVAGGDRVRFAATVRDGADLIVSTATAERIYRSPGSATQIGISLNAAAGARIGWLPQPTILFSGARLIRRIEVDVSGTAQFLMAEATVFGRTASGERMGPGLFRDSWRIRRDGRLILAEETQIDGHVAQHLGRPTVAGNANTTALLVYIAPDAEDLRAPLRAALCGVPAETGVTAWRGMLVLRLLAHGLDDAQRVLRQAGALLTRLPVPQVWQS